MRRWLSITRVVKKITGLKWRSLGFCTGSPFRIGLVDSETVPTISLSRSYRLRRNPGCFGALLACVPPLVVATEQCFPSAKDRACRELNDPPDVRHPAPLRVGCLLMPIIEESDENPDQRPYQQEFAHETAFLCFVSRCAGRSVRERPWYKQNSVSAIP